MESLTFLHMSNDDPGTIRARIDRALAGDPGSKRELAERLLRFRPLVYKHLKFRHGGSHTVADTQVDDCLQDLLVVLLFRERPVIDRFSPTLGTFPAFIAVVLRRWVGRWVERQRKGSPNPALTDTAEQSQLHDEIERALFARAVLALLLRDFSPRDRLLYRRLIVEEESRADVSRSEGIRVDALHQWCSRLMRRAAEIAAALERSSKLPPIVARPEVESR